jgi:hypothetical protein
VLSRLNLTAERSCSSDNATDACPSSPCGTTFVPSTGDHGGDSSMSSRAVSLAREYPQLAEVQDLRTSGRDSGEKWPASLAKYDPDTCSWRTHQFSLRGELELFSATWPRWGLMRGGECWGLDTPAHHTDAIDCGFWPTPVKTDGFAVGWCETSIARKERGETRPSGARIGSGLKYYRKTERYLSGGYPNPMFTEWLMGWPIKWTDLQPLETGRYQAWLHSHGER